MPDLHRSLANFRAALDDIKRQASYGKTYETIMGVATSRRNELLSGA